MSISQVTPTGAPSPSTAQGPSAPSAATQTAKTDADGDFDGSKTANDDAVKVTLSDAAIKTLASKAGGQGA